MDRLKKWFKKSGYVLLFVVSFIFFLYLTFPYGVLKESMAAFISKQAGLDIHIGELRPSLPLGFDMTDVTLAPVGGGPVLELKEVQIDFSMLNLLFGAIAINLDLLDKDRGEFEASVKFSLIDLLKKNFMPYKIAFDANKFGIGQFIAFGLNRMAMNPNNPAGQLFTPLLDQMKIVGKMQGEASFFLDVGNLSESTGSVDLKLADAALKLENASLDMADQTFSKAAFKANMASGNLTITKDSGFHTQELMLDFSGDAKLKPQIGQSLLNFNIGFRLDKGLKDKFGFIIDAKGGTDGAIRINIKGTVDRPNVTTS